MRRMGIGLGVGINRSNYAQGIFNAYNARVVADGGITEAGNCVNAVSSLLQSASLLLIPSGYKGGKAYAEIPTNGNGDLTWTRASDAWRTNADGLIQRVPWNLLQQSETFSNAIWTKSNTTVTIDSAVAPNGTTTADTLTPSTSDSNIRQSFTPSNVAQYTFSVYIRSATGSDISTSIRVWRDSPFQNITNTPITVTSTWQRFTLTFTPLDSTAHSLVIGGNSTLSTGENLFIWGAQVNEGSSAQTYLPTTDRLNVPRLSYMYGSCPALLLEPQRTNLATYSDDFSNAAWTKTNSTVTANSTTSPDGTTNADSLVDNSTLGIHALSAVNIGGAGTYTFSFYAKANTLSRVGIFTNSAVNLNLATTALVFDLSSGVVVNSVSGITASIQSVGNGWHRCSAVIPSSASGNYLITTSNGGTTVNYIGSGQSIFVYGAQLEAGAYPTTYIPTTTASATRIADSFSRNNIYTNGLITSSGGTWFVELRGNLSLTRDTFTLTPLIIGDSSTSPNNGLLLRNSGGSSMRLEIRKLIAGSTTLLYTTTTDTTKVAIKWNGSSCDVFVNGTKQVSASFFATTNMEFLVGSGVDVPKFIQAMALYPTPLSDTDCTTLTTL
jgi:hypothetical protein